MRNALPLLIAGTCLSLLPLLGPAASTVPAGLERSRSCAAPEAGVATTARNWLGSLHGWQDSPLVLLWRSNLAAAKGKQSPALCADESGMR
ncbi:MAG: hypothetical protein WCP77_01150 [Roseococcus sp.]